MRYGMPTNIGIGKELFQAGAFGDVSGLDILLYRQHTRALALARTKPTDADDYGRLVLDDNEKRFLIQASLPDTTDSRDTLELVKAKILRGLSVEFKPLQVRWDGLTRVIQKARLSGISVVDKPAYADSAVELRWADMAKDAAPPKRKVILWR